jgi:hypothetical protein
MKTTKKIPCLIPCWCPKASGHKRRGPASPLPTRAVPTLLFVTLCNWNKLIRIMKTHLSVRQTLEESSLVKKFYFKNVYRSIVLYNGLSLQKQRCISNAVWGDL